MRIVILTTDTPHHRYFIRQFLEQKPKDASVPLVVFETRPYPWRTNAQRHFRQTLPNVWNGIALNPYLQPATFNTEQTAYEHPRFFLDGDDSLPSGLPVVSVSNVNDETSCRIIGELKPDVFFVYGTGKLHSRVFSLPPLGSINAHGGLLPWYRGLDTSLWATLQGKPDQMAITLHRIEKDLDTGAVVAERRIGPAPELSIYSLRYFTTIPCLDLFLKVTRDLLAGSLHEEKHDPVPGSYYGPMPWLLKRKADRLLRRWVADGRSTTALNTSAHE